MGREGVYWASFVMVSREETENEDSDSPVPPLPPSVNRSLKTTENKKRHSDACG